MSALARIYRRVCAVIKTRNWLTMQEHDPCSSAKQGIRFLFYIYENEPEEGGEKTDTPVGAQQEDLMAHPRVQTRKNLNR